MQVSFEEDDPLTQYGIFKKTEPDWPEGRTDLAWRKRRSQPSRQGAWNWSGVAPWS